MDKKLHILHHLYGEDDDPAARDALLGDPALRAEYEALASVRAALDARSKPRPDAAVLDAVLAAAAAPGGPPPRARTDRAPKPRRAARRYRRLGALSAVVAVLLVVGIGLQQGVLAPMLQESTTPSEAEAVLAAPKAEREEAFADQPAEAEPQNFEAQLAPTAPAPPAMAGARQRGVAPAPEATPPARTEAPRLAEGFADVAAADEEARADDAAVEVAEADAVSLGRSGIAGAMNAAAMANVDADAALDTSAVPAWDEADAVQRIHRRLELIEARSSALNWDEIPAVSLDALPARTGTPEGVKPARQKRDGH